MENKTKIVQVGFSPLPNVHKA